MANIYSKAGSPYFWMRFTVKGKRYQESTKQKDRAKATKVMEKRVKQLAEFGGIHDIFDQLLIAIERENNKAKRLDLRRDLARRILSDEVVALPLSDAFAVYRDKPFKRNPSKATLDSYERIWSAFLEWITDNRPEITKMHEVDHAVGTAYMDSIWAGKCTQRTYNWKLTFLKGFFKKLTIESNITINPFAHIESMVLQTESREPLSDAQFNKVLKNAKGEMRTLILIGAYTGLRLGDAVQLKWSEVDLAGRMIYVTPRKTRKLKKNLEIPLHGVLLEELMKMPRNRMYVVPDLRKRFEDSHTLVSDDVRHLFESAGIKVHGERADGRGQVACRYSFHSLRHTFVTNCAKAGVPQQVVMDLVGHGSAAVNNIYTHIDNGMKREGIDRLSDVREGVAG